MAPMIRIGVLVAILAFPAFAGACTVCEGKVPITFYGDFCANGGYSVVLTDDNDSGNTKTASGSSSGCAYGMTSVETLNIKPKQTMTLKAPGAKYSSLHINLKVEGCYKIKIDGEEKTDINESGTDCDTTQGEKTWSVVVVPASDNGGPGTGGDSSGGLNSVHWQFSMGGLSDGSSAGSISLSEATITSASYNPDALLYVAPSAEVEVIRNAGILRQIKAPECLADIKPDSSNSSKYEIRYYLAANAGSKVGGLYVPVGSPFVTHTIENPSGAPAGHLRISESRGGIATANDIIYDPATKAWSYNRAGRRLETLTTMNLVNGDTKVTRVVSDPATSIVALKTVETKHTFPWGMEVIQRIEDPDGSPITTDYTYYENIADGGGYRHMKSFARSDGYWEYYEYSSGETDFGNLARTYRPGKDDPASPQAGGDNYSEYSYYYPQTSYYGGSRFASARGGEAITAFGQSLGSTSYLWDYYEDVDGQPATAVYNHPTFRNETEVVTYTSAAAVPYRDQIAEEVHADGRVDHYDYELGNYSGGVFVPGTGSHRRVTVTHGTEDSPAGIDSKTTREITIRAPSGQILEEQTQVYSGGAYAAATKTTHGHNSEGRLTSSTKDGRVIYETNWTGDRKQWEKDEAGIQTSYTYDALGRVETEIRQAVTTTHTYDAEDRVRSTTRSSGGLTLASSTVFDAAGRVLSETTEAGLMTTTAYSHGGSTVTRTLPSLATEITDHYADGRVKSITGTGVIERFYDYGADWYGRWTQEFLGGESSERWTKTYTNVHGDVTRIERPAYGGGTVAIENAVDGRGLLVSRTVSGEVSELYEYDELGQLTRQGRDVDWSGVLDLAGVDEVTVFASLYASENGGWYAVNTTSRCETATAAPALVSTSKQLLGGDATTLSKAVEIDRFGKTITSTATVNRATQTVTETRVASDSSVSAVRTIVNGRLVSESTNTVSQPTSYEYDALGRLDKITDPRGVVTDPVYTGAVLSSATAADQAVSYTYYSSGQAGAGQLWTTTYADGKTEVRGYDLRANLTDISGTGVYKQHHTIDAYGQRTELYTYRQGATGDKTTWTYDAATGLLTAKTDASGKSVIYDYTDTNRLLSRTWARNVTTTYSYDPLGNLASKDYSDGTPDVTISYDRVNRPVKVFDGAGVHVMSYTPKRETEVALWGPNRGLVASREFDGYGRLKAVNAQTDAWNQSVGYAYDGASRLQTVSLYGSTATYGYLANSDLLATTTFANPGTVLTTTRTWDAANRLKKISHGSAAGTLSYDVTVFDSRDRRKEVASADSSKWIYTYDDLGQVTGGSRLWSDASQVEGQQYGYGYDGAGNRTATTLNMRSATYTPNALNQYTSRTIPGAVDVIGSAASTAAVTVNGAGASRKGEYFYKLLTASNTTGPVAVSETISATLASGTTTRNRTVLVPKTPETFTYDFDGNVTQDGLWSYTWDAENRLIAMESVAAVPAAQKRKLAFDYDWQGRRVSKWVWHWVNNAWLLHDHHRFIYSGWNLQAEVGDSGQPVRTYAWGLDLSGTIEGAGGIGGLLFEKKHYAAKTFAAASDLNGNIGRLVDLGSGLSAADYEYGPFGEVIRASGEYAALNPFGFSSKYADWETHLIYYGYRYYNPVLGRWVNRDPIGERGGRNLYGMVGNNPISRIDLFGLQAFEATAVAKSYIAKIGDQDKTILDPANGHSNPDWLNNGLVNGSQALAEWLYGLNEDPQGDDKDGQYRLFSKVKFKFCCKTGKIEFNNKEGEGYSIEKDGGSEALWGLISGTMNVDGFKMTKSGDSAYTFQWRGYGRPNKLAEPSFQFIKLRNSVNIWHKVTGRIYCNGEKGYVEATLSGSAFPSHRLWLMGELKTTIPQGSLANLWESDPSDSDFVK